MLSVSVKTDHTNTHLPVLGLALEQDGILRLADLTGIVILDLLNVDLSLDTVILRECALMALLQSGSD